MMKKKLVMQNISRIFSDNFIETVGTWKVDGSKEWGGGGIALRFFSATAKTTLAYFIGPSFIGPII